jgi:hypothetical protein
MNRLALVSAVFALGACATNSTSHDQSAELAFFSTFATLQTIQSAALAAQPAVAPVVQTINYSGPCAAGGTATMTGMVDGDGTTTGTFTLDTTLAGCTEGGDTLDGSLHWIGTQTATTFMETMTGTVAYQGPQYAGTFGWDLTISVDTSTNMVVVAGGYTLGGTHYTVTNWASGH